MGWFVGNIDVNRKDKDVNIYEILFKDGDTEEWNQYEYDKNAADTCIHICDIGFRFIYIFLEDNF